MASTQAKIDAVKAAIASTSTCSPAAVVALKDLLLPDPPEPQAPRPKSSTGRATTKTPTGSRAKSRTGVGDGVASHGELSARDKAALATHVINAALKSLTEVARPSPNTNNTAVPAAKRTLQLRTDAAPLSPIQPKALNRVAPTASPSVAQHNGAKPAPASQSTGCLATIECARVAFACLRHIKGPMRPDQADFQLENGMSALAGKLIALGMYEQALKELRVLKRRLDGSDARDRDAPNGTMSMESGGGGAAAVMSDLLRFDGEMPQQSLPTVTGFQVHLLKLVAATKKSSYVEAILPRLRDSEPASPANLLLALAKTGEKEVVAKAARQLASLSQLLLSLAPSIASQEDVVAVEPRLSPSPMAAFELQCLAFRTQLRWWKLAGHKGSVDDELLGPFARCARAFVRRQKALPDVSIYQSVAEPFDELTALVRAQKHRPSAAFTSPLVSIYQILASVAQTERLYDEAYRWLLEVKALLVPGQESSVRVCSISARLLAAALKRTALGDDVEELARDVADGLDGSLSGTVTELNELLESLSLARRSVVGVLMTLIGPNGSKQSTPGTLETLLKTFLLRYPRFVRRWLGSPPGKDAAQKQVLQFDQRRQLVLQSVNQVLDATLMVIKCDIQSSTGEWQPLDDVLQHCHSLIDTLSASSPLSTARAEDLNTYRLKISSLYFSIFALLRKKPKRTKEEERQLLVSLNRSIDSVRDCTAAEKEKSQLFVKLELFADLCKGAGRTEDAVRILRSVCTSMAEDGALSDVVEALAAKPPVLAWRVTDRASTMSRTLRSIARLDKAWNEWTFLLPEPERAAVLEHLMHLTTSGSSNGTTTVASRPLRLQDPSVAALLKICTLEKYPVRRLRILLRLLHQNIGEADQTDEITALVDQALGQAQEDVGEDILLEPFIPHLRTYSSSLSAFVEADEDFPAATVAEAVSAWKSMVETCETQADLLEHVDDPEGLLDHLRSLNQLAGLKGESLVQLSIVELSIAISRLDVGPADPKNDAVILHYSQLVAHYVNVGLFPQALETLRETQALVAQREGNLSRRILAEFHISQAEYYTGIGDMATATACLDKAHAICSDPYSSWAESKSQATLMLSTTSLLQSIVTLEVGDIQDALGSIKASVRMLSHDWSKLEVAVKGGIGSTSILSESDASSVCADPGSARVAGPRFWNLASPLLRGLLHMSSVYAHIGMFQETVYYADSAWKMAESLRSSLFMAQVSAWTGSVYLKASKIPKALGYFKLAEDQLPQGISAARVRFARQIGEFYGEIGEEEKAAELFKMAEDTARLLGRNGAKNAAPETPEEDQAVEGVRTRSRKAAPAARSTRSTRSTRSKTAAAAQATKRGANAAQTQAVSTASIDEMPKDIYQASLLAAIEISRSLAHIHQKDWASALASLEQVKSLPKLTGVLSLEQVMTAISLIGHSMEQMISDPVFSVMQDSTISFPAVSASIDAGKHESTTSAALSHQKREPRGSVRDGGENGVTPPFADALGRAQELLMEAHSSALCSADSGMIRRISTLLQSTIIFLSATSAAESRSACHSGMATVAVDIARNVTWTREQQTLTAIDDYPPGTTKSQRPSVELAADMAKFRRRYIDLLPKKWSVISISLSDNRHDLCITKFQAGHSPFILRLPLERANSRDADSEIFNFDHGRDELLEIIRLANETSHSARDFSAKGERGAWWAERETLDNRLKELLVTIETTWLGGFKGIFSQHQRRPDLLARFQKSFRLMLDQNLPSRNHSRGKAASGNAEPVVLDPRILDLFIGLGDPADPDYDFDEALNDLLYFVVDILQFHGERNAYDEIDFDAMVVQTYDALRGYHNEVKATHNREDGAHTILVLEKALHAFPWESLPCMEGLAVSRVPSLAALRRLVTDSALMSPGSGADDPAGHYVSARSGTCILNPSSDLKNTQAFFQPAFSALASWTSIVGTRPQEADFEKALAGSDVVVYFGHGSGAQYIRGKTVRRLGKCRPATFLMGCSSAALAEAGGFECYGPVWNYMMAGCPAVVGTLWDVTDRDIDRFAGRAFEEWGLFARGTFAARDKGKQRTGRAGDEIEDEEDGDGDDVAPRSLAEAVARARTACRFRYLNAAAVVMYGIPVYISREDGDKK